MSAKVSRISRHDLWLLLGEREMFLSYDDVPWFTDASVSAIKNVSLLKRIIFTGLILILI